MTSVRRVLAVSAAAAIIILVLGIALTLKVQELRQVKDVYAAQISDLERDRQRQEETIRALRAELESEKTKVIALQQTLEATRAQLIVLRARQKERVPAPSNDPAARRP